MLLRSISGLSRDLDEDVQGELRALLENILEYIQQNKARKRLSDLDTIDAELNAAFGITKKGRVKKGQKVHRV